MEFERQSKHSGLCPDTSSLVFFGFRNLSLHPQFIAGIQFFTGFHRFYFEQMCAGSTPESTDKLASKVNLFSDFQIFARPMLNHQFFYFNSPIICGTFWEFDGNKRQ